MERAWLCGLVVLLWTLGDASMDNQGRTYPEELYPTGGPGITEAPSFHYRWAAALSLLAAFAWLFICSLCCCKFHLSRSPTPEPPPNVEWIHMEDLGCPESSPTSLRSHLSVSVGDPQGHLDVPPPSPVVQFHHAYADDVEDKAIMRSSVFHPSVPHHISQLSIETEPSLEQ